MSNVESHLKKQGFLIADGATGTELMKLGALKAGIAPERLAVDNPQALIKVHRSYFEAGSDFVVTNTFGGSRTKLEEWGLDKELIRLNVAAVDCVRTALKESGRNGFIAAELGPCGRLLQPLGNSDMEELILIFREQVKVLYDAGVDLFVTATMSDLREAKAAYIAVRDICKIPVGISLTFNVDSTTLVNNTPEAVAVAFDSTDILFLGANCSVGPKDMGNVLLRMAEYTDKPLLAKPNAGIDGGKKFSVEEFKEELSSWGNSGVKVFGGCCVTTPEYIKMLRAELPKIKLNKKIEKKQGSHLASHSKVVSLGGHLPPVIIGERINPTNKKPMIEELKNACLDIVKDFARTQINDGASLLDVNLGAAGIDELGLMKKAFNTLGSIVDAPLVVDSSKPQVVEAALRNYGGKVLINSTTGEKEKVEQILPLVKKYGAAVLVLCMDEKGIPTKAEDRFNVAQKVVNIAKEYGIDKNNIFVDTLTLSLSSNQSEVMETVKAITLVKDKLNLPTVLGVSNVSYGLPMRENLNSTFLTLAINAGLDCAIINPSSEKLRSVFDSMQVIKGFDTFAVKYVGKYSNVEKDTGIKVKPTEPVAALRQAIIDGDDIKAVNSVNILLENGKEPVNIATESLIPAIEIVGRYFKEGRYFLPQVVMSAQAMKKSFDIIKSKLNAGDVKYQARVVMATVQGDIHDIGKNIVSTLLETNGFEVIDLGKSVSASEIVTKTKQLKPDFIGLSALMTTTMEEMPKVIDALNKAKINTPVMIGGAVVTEDYAKQIGAKFYAKDAMEAVDVLKSYLRKGNDD